MSITNVRWSVLEQLESRRLLSANVVADVGGVYPTDAATVSGVSYFSANDGVHGTELWKSDGTIAGTKIVKDLVKGANGSEITDLTVIGDKVLFISRAGSVAKLWASDGTAEGTVVLATLGENQMFASIAGDKMIIVDRGPTGGEAGAIWASDGTKDGTQVLVHANIGGFGAGALYSVGNRVVFGTDDHVWSTDGTVAGTFTIPQDGGGWHLGLDSYNLLGDKVVIYDGHTRKLWKTDGTLAGTQLIKDLATFTVYELKPAGDIMLLAGHDGADGKDYVLATDGTATGTAPIAQADHGYFHDVVKVGDKWFFVTRGSTALTVQLWSTDGTAAGTQKVKAFEGGGGEVILGEAGGVLFITVHGEQRTTLYKSDGTSAGTTAVRNLKAPNGTPANVESLIEAEGKLVISMPGQQSVVIDPATLTTLQGPKQASNELINGTLRIAGTRGNDTIRVTLDSDKSHIVVRINGHRTSFAVGDVKNIYIYGYGGNDDISIYEAYGVVNARSKVFGGDGNDTIFTGSARDTVYGENGNDTVNTWLGNDIAMGGAGDDSVMAGAGNDTASGDDGTDWVNGGDGNDVVSGGNDNSKDHIEGGAGTDVLFGKAVVEIFYGGKTDKDSGNPDEVLLT